MAKYKQSLNCYNDFSKIFKNRMEVENSEEL